MKYIINHQVVFCNQTRIISLLDNIENSLSLSEPASRLLLTLIIENKTTLTRAYLLTKVWEEYGLTASGNNLNNYMSELRKSLTQLAPNLDIIATIPKVGFQLNATIETISSLNVTNNMPLTAQETITLNLSDIDEPYLQKEKWSYSDFILIVGLFILTISICYSYYSNIDLNNNLKESSKFIFSTGNCNVFSLDEFTTLNDGGIIEFVKKDIVDFNINCTTNTNLDIYYSSIPSQPSHFEEKYFLSVCSVIEKNYKHKTYKNCYTIIRKA